MPPRSPVQIRPFVPSAEKLRYQVSTSLMQGSTFSGIRLETILCLSRQEDFFGFQMICGQRIGRLKKKVVRKGRTSAADFGPNHVFS